jgi:hypothetical protein
MMTELFIEKAKLKHEDKYDYSKVEYVNSHTQIIIICKDHGDFLQIPNKHLLGTGCIKCLGRNIVIFKINLLVYKCRIFLPFKSSKISVSIDIGFINVYQLFCN